MILIIIGFAFLLLLNFYLALTVFHILEAVHTFRQFIVDAKAMGEEGGGYYQTLSFPAIIGLKYLESKCELSYKTLPQGGYNVYKYNWRIASK